jgi:hypothetical protein
MVDDSIGTLAPRGRQLISILVRELQSPEAIVSPLIPDPVVERGRVFGPSWYVRREATVGDPRRLIQEHKLRYWLWIHRKYPQADFM